MNLLTKLLFGFVLIGCTVEDGVLPREEFVKIYDDDRFSEQYDPLDIIETSDMGYIMLSFYRREDTNFRGLNIHKVDQLGDYTSGMKFANDFVSPIKPMMENGGKYYFFCMDQFSLGAQLIELDENGVVLNVYPVSTTYPLAASKDGNNFILQSYDHVAKRTVLSVIDPTGAIMNTIDFDIGAGDGVEEPIIDHFNQTGRYLPFLAGKTSNGLYYLNGFYNFTLSLVFTDLTDTNPNGVCQGQQSEGGISAVVPTGNDLFAVARFNFGENFINPHSSISTSEISSSVDLGGNSFPEISRYATVELKELPINGQNVLMYATTTNSRQIVLMAYSKSDHTLNALEYLGFANPYELAGFTSTSDGGLAVIGKTHVAGRFPRICLFKISSSRIARMGNQGQD